MKDIIIIGGGPGGLTAAIYAKRAGADVALFEKMSPGGQLMTTPDIENYPGFIGTGFDLSMKMHEQVTSLNIDFYYKTIKSIEKKDDIFFLKDENDNIYSAKSVIVASGAARKKLGIKGEEEFTGRGVSYCATCDGNFFKNKISVVIGGGNTAVEDALYLSNICKKVYLIHRRDVFRASKALTDRLDGIENLEIIYNAIPLEISGDDKVNCLIIENKISGEQQKIETDSVFVAVGTLPITDFLPDNIEKNYAGYIVTNEKCQTNIDGLYAIGDVRNTPLKQVVTACADGAIASSFAVEYLNNK